MTRACLARADLTRADLSRADLTRTSLTRADLARSALARASLTRSAHARASLIRAGLARADAGIPARCPGALACVHWCPRLGRVLRIFIGDEERCRRGRSRRGGRPLAWRNGWPGHGTA
ncbi:pentapeptide repeat-containing protein [Kineosporia sp. NBRC 101677]|uniref:pentapeptide repeat-containing protein n=1 Tax=Kineosporia sp. NBRC 101677 TaxID=3032197 RepID=UPI00332A9CBB